MTVFKPRYRLEYIKKLLNADISDECHLRSIVHQAYYAALNQLQYEIDNRLFFPMDGKDRYERSHQAVIDACANQIRKLKNNDLNKEILNRVYSNMKRARAIRVHADYNLESEMMKHHSTVVVNYANQIFDDLESYI